MRYGENFYKCFYKMNEIMINYLQEFENVNNYDDFYNRYSIIIRSFISLDRPNNSDDLYCICRVVYLLLLEDYNFIHFQEIDSSLEEETIYRSGNLN